MMNIRSRLISLLLAAALGLTLCACGKQTDGSAGEASPSPSPSPSEGLGSDAEEESGPNLEDLDLDAEDLCLAAAGIPGDFTLFTVDGIPVSAQLYLYWLAYNATSLSAYMTLDWSEEAGLADYLRTDALNASALYTLIPAKAKELGFSLTQEQQDELDASLSATVESVGGEEAFQEELRKIGLDQETFYSINAASYYYGQLMDGLFAGRPTAEEIEEYITGQDLLRAKHILFMTVDSTTREPLEESVIAEKKALAEQVLAQLQASTDLEADFDRLMNEYSEDPGLAYYPDGYTFTAGEMVSEFEDATRALEYGGLSGLVYSETTGYHIILRLDPAELEETREDFRTALMDDQVQTWLDEAEFDFTDAYDNLDVQSFFQTFMAYQEAFSAARAEDAAQEPSENPSEEPVG